MLLLLSVPMRVPSLSVCCQFCQQWCVVRRLASESLDSCAFVQVPNVAVAPKFVMSSDECYPRSYLLMRHRLRHFLSILSQAAECRLRSTPRDFGGILVHLEKAALQLSMSE